MGYFKPATPQEAVRAIAGSADGFFLGGGTDIAVMAAGGLIDPKTFVDTTSISEINGIEVREGALWIGAGTPVAVIAVSPVVPECLRKGAGAIGSPQIRNLATLGGNICNASPCGDTLAPLVVLNATFHLLSADGPRSVKAEEFFIGPKKTVRKQGELLTGVTIQASALAGSSRFFKTGKRKGQMIAQTNCAVHIVMKGTTIDGIRIAAGSVAPIPLRLSRTEALLAGRKFGEISESALRDSIIGEISPIDDVRGSAEYRRAVTANAIVRMIGECAGASEGEKR